MRAVPLDTEQGHVALGLALRHLANVGVFMHTTAHPDDENNGLLVMLNRGQGYRTALATATRGNGGQNEIGPEIFEELGVLRTEELASLHRFDGAEQYFTRAVDFGYSFGIDETFEKWGRDEITADYVRLIRTIRPDVVVTLPPVGNAGGQHHMASAVITHDAVKLAGDPTKYPEQISEGLHPWQVKKLYQSAGFGFPGEPQVAGPLTRVNADVYDPLLGKTYAEIGSEARSMHKCQGMGQLLSLPGPSAASYRLVESTDPAAARRDVAVRRPRHEHRQPRGVRRRRAAAGAHRRARRGGVRGPRRAGRVRHARATRRRWRRSSPASTPCARFAPRSRACRSTTPRATTSTSAWRRRKREFQQAALIANGVRIDVLADDGVVVPGQAVKVNTIVANGGAADVTVKQVTFAGFGGDASCTMTAFAGGGFGFPGGGRGGRGANAPPEAPMSDDSPEPGRALRADAAGFPPTRA